VLGADRGESLSIEGDQIGMCSGPSLDVNAPRELAHANVVEFCCTAYLHTGEAYLAPNP